jgi:hypothetical protein
MKTIFRKAVVLALAILFSAAPKSMIAQGDQSNERYFIGVRGGFSLPADTPVDEVFPGIYPSKPVFGIFLLAISNKFPWFSGQWEVLYLAQSAIYDAFLGEVETSRKYIQLNGILKLRLSSKSLVTPILFAGPAFTFLLKTSRIPDIEDPLNPKFNNVIYSFVFGGGLDAEVGKLLLSLDVRYDQGYDALGWESKDPKPNMLLVMAGIGF